MQESLRKRNKQNRNA